MPCPPCKVIIDDGGRIVGAAESLVEFFRFDDSKAARKIAAAAIDMARTMRGIMESLTHAVRTGVIPPISPAMDEAHALSELSCRRAKTIRGWLAKDAVPKDAAARLTKWTEYSATKVTALLGGEYDGGFVVVGDERIEKKL